MLVRRFKWDTESDFGEGWTPTFIGGADPTSGFGAAHDCLEHFPRCIGGFEGEMMALGAMHFVRGKHYDWRSGNIYDNQEPDIARFLEAIAWGDQSCNDPGVVRGRSNYLNRNRLRVAIRQGVADFTRESANGGDRTRAEALRDLPTDIAERIEGWMMKGVIKAEKRFARWGLQGWQVSDLFNQISEKFDNAAKHSGDFNESIEVRVNFAERKVRVDRISDYHGNAHH